LAQDPEINDIQMKEFRMQLEQSLEACEQKAKRVRRRILIGLAVYVVCMVIYIALMSRWGNAVPNPAAVLWRQYFLVAFLVAAMAAGLIGLSLIVRYIFVYVPKLTRARFELQKSLLLELQQQVKQLQERLERSDK
jgi:hypothetical protein